jgi:hypothetical protein
MTKNNKHPKEQHLHKMLKVQNPHKKKVNKISHYKQIKNLNNKKILNLILIKQKTIKNKKVDVVDFTIFIIN